MATRTRKKLTTIDENTTAFNNLKKLVDSIDGDQYYELNSETRKILLESARIVGDDKFLSGEVNLTIDVDIRFSDVNTKDRFSTELKVVNQRTGESVVLTEKEIGDNVGYSIERDYSE